MKTRFLCLLLSLLTLVPLDACAGEAGTPPEETANLEEPAGERYFTDSAGYAGGSGLPVERLRRGAD